MTRIEPQVIAEIGCNHKGDLDTAKKMIGIAATFAKCDVVKFQKRCVRELLSGAAYDAPHPNEVHSYGSSYGKHRDFLEFSVDQHRELLDCCKTFGIGYSTSVWDVTSAREIAGLEPELIKVPSACNLNFAMLDVLALAYQGAIHLSLGMTTRDETRAIVEHLESLGAAERTVLYACTSGYPVAFDEACLLEIDELTTTYGTRVAAIGFSGHHLGIAIDIGAVTLGATWLERHFTLDRTWRGTDHAASLEPDGLRRLVRDVRAVSAALTYKQEDILPIETIQRRKLKFGSIRVA